MGVCDVICVVLCMIDDDGGYSKSGRSSKVLLLDERAVEGDLLHLQQFLMDDTCINTSLPNTKGGLMIFVRFLLPFRLNEPRQLQ